jgi:hypothetical protein
MNKLERIIALGMLLFAIGFNLWLYRAEPTGMVDPNDNAFQYALVDRTNQIWDYADRICPQGFFSLPSSAFCHLELLIDHWVPNWAEGYNLPYYYSHVPQIVIVGTYRLLSVFRLPSSAFSIFQYYHWLIYFLLCFFPISVFLSLRILKQPWLTAGIGALLASHISTDGLYGIDPESFLWRGWGLSSQLFAMIFMPLALAYAIRWMNDKYTAENGVGEQFFKELKICLQKIVRINHTANLHLVRGKEHQDSDIRNRASLKNSLPNPRAHEFLYAIVFITATTMGHLGLGLMLFLSLPVIALTQPLLSFLHQSSLKHIWEESKTAGIKTLLLALPPLVLLSYWIIPTILHGAYHNVSFWDPVWKFNSYGAKEILVNLFNGSLFDWGRLPIYTTLVFIGFFICLLWGWRVARTGGSPSSDRNPAKCYDNLEKEQESYICGQKTHENCIEVCGMRTSDGEKCVTGPALSFLFLFFLLLYFGKTTWGGILDFIPSMSEFHQHRFIVGVHLVGLFLAPIGLSFLVQIIWRGGIKFSKIASRALQFIRMKYKKTDNQQKSRPSISLSRAADRENLCYAASQIGVTLLLLILILPPIYKQTMDYGTYNQTLIEKANATYLTQKADAELLLQTLQELIKNNPGRVFAGRGGSWGKNFQIAETSYFMHLSTYGIPTVLWLPQTWSNNSDTEQYFSEDNQSHYDLYNIRYVVTPPDTKPQPFWTLIKETDHWKLYEIQNTEVGKQKTENPSSDIPASPAGGRSPSSSSYITSGVSPSVVYSDKLSFGNVIRLWIQSPYPGKSIFPELNLTHSDSSASQGEALRSKIILPHFRMIDEASYQTPDGKTHSLFAEPPQYMTPWEWPSAFPQYPISNINPISNFKFQISNYMNILSQSSDTDMVFRAIVKVSPLSAETSAKENPSSVIGLPSSVSCPTCTVILKQTYHPNWRAMVNGKPAQTISVFPSYTAIRLEEAGKYEVVFTYTPSKFKMLLLFGGIGSIILLLYVIIKKRK